MINKTDMLDALYRAMGDIVLIIAAIYFANSTTTTAIIFVLALILGAAVAYLRERSNKRKQNTTGNI